MMDTEQPGNGHARPVVLEARSLKKHFPVNKGLLISRVTGWIKAVDGVSFELREGGDPGSRGRVGLRQEHDGQDAAHAGTAHRGQHSVPGRGHSQGRRRSPQGVPQLGPGGLPGPVELPEPPDTGQGHHSRADGHQLEPLPEGDARAGGQAAPGRGAPSLSRRPVSPRVQRRPEATPCHSQEPGPQPPGHSAGRAGLGPGRIHKGPDHEPAHRPAGRVQRELRPDRPQPGDGQVHVPLGGGDVPGADSGAGRGAGALRQSPAPLHQGP